MKQDLPIIVVEDEGVIAEHLKIILINQGFNNITLVHDKVRALQLIQQIEPALLILDIRMQELFDGIEIAQSELVHNKIPFIFITAQTDDYVLKKALDTKPAGFITKPFNQASVFAAVNIAMEKYEQRVLDHIVVKDGFEVFKISLNEICYIQSEGNYIDIFTGDGKKSIRHSLEWFIKQVPESQFIRVHRSYVINMKKVSRVVSGTIFIGDSEIPVSRKLFQDIRNRILTSSF